MILILMNSYGNLLSEFKIYCRILGFFLDNVLVYIKDDLYIFFYFI